MTVWVAGTSGALVGVMLMGGIGGDMKGTSGTFGGQRSAGGIDAGWRVWVIREIKLLGIRLGGRVGGGGIGVDVGRMVWLGERVHGGGRESR